MLATIRQDLAELLVAERMPPAVIGVVTEKLIERLRMRYGGDRVFIQKVDRARRAADILADWKAGYDPDDIAERREVDRATVYRVIGKRNQRKAGSNEDGFGSEDWNL